MGWGGHLSGKGKPQTTGRVWASQQSKGGGRGRRPGRGEPWGPYGSDNGHHDRSDSHDLRTGKSAASHQGASKSKSEGAHGAGMGKGAGTGNRQQAHARGVAIAQGRPVWNFAFGANINPWKLESARGIKPLEAVQGLADGWRLIFNHRGGFGSIERLREDHLPGPKAVHGMLLLLNASDFATLCQMEHQYDPTEIDVETYEGRSISARAFISMPAFRTLAQDLAAPERYMKLLRDGAKSSKLDSTYVDWLCSLPSNSGERGPEYYAVEGKQPHTPDKRAVRQSNAGSADKLRAPTGVFVVGDWVYVAESQSDRVLRFPRPQLSRTVGSLCTNESEIVAGGNGKGSALTQLNRPFRVFVDCSEAVFVVDRNNARVVRWSRGASQGVVVAGGFGPGAGLHQLDQPSGIFVHNHDIFVADRANHRVVCWAPGATEGVVVAGGHGFGSEPSQLACPGALSVTNESIILVSDEANNRIQAWAPGATEGYTVAGGSPPGSGSQELYHPLGLCLRTEENLTMLFVGDSLNYRVQQFPVILSATGLGSATAGRSSDGMTVAGGRGLGSTPEQLGQPISVCIDGHSNLYIADSDNGRVQIIPLDAQMTLAKASLPASSLTAEDRQQHEGLVSEFRVGPGYGFIDAKGLRYFAHHSDILQAVEHGYPTLRRGDRVQFFPRQDAKWGRRATMIKAVLEDGLSTRQRS